MVNKRWFVVDDLVHLSHSPLNFGQIVDDHQDILFRDLK